MAVDRSKASQGKGFGNQAKPSQVENSVQEEGQARSGVQMKPANIDAANQAKSLAQQSVDGATQYIGNTSIDVLNQLRAAKFRVVDTVSDAIAEEMHPDRVRSDVMTAALGKLQSLQTTDAGDFEWGSVPEFSSPSQLPVVDISHLVPSSLTRESKQLAASQSK